MTEPEDLEPEERENWVVCSTCKGSRRGYCYVCSGEGGWDPDKEPG